MAKQNVDVVSFNGGEIGPPALARTDLASYPKTAETMENLFPTVAGEMSKAPGSLYLDDITALAEVNDEDGGIELDEDSTTALTEGESLAFVRPFIRSETSALALEVSANQIRFIDDTAYVTLDGAAATIGAWSDETSAPPAGGDPPIEPGSGDVGDPYYPDLVYESYLRPGDE